MQCRSRRRMQPPRRSLEQSRGAPAASSCSRASSGRSRTSSSPVLARAGIAPPAIVLANAMTGLVAALALADGRLLARPSSCSSRRSSTTSDGQLARITGRVTLLGRYLDTEADLLVNAVVFARYRSCHGAAGSRRGGIRSPDARARRRLQRDGAVPGSRADSPAVGLRAPAGGPSESSSRSTFASSGRSTISSAGSPGGASSGSSAPRTHLDASTKPSSRTSTGSWCLCSPTSGSRASSSFSASASHSAGRSSISGSFSPASRRSCRSRCGRKPARELLSVRPAQGEALAVHG